MIATGLAALLLVQAAPAAAPTMEAQWNRCARTDAGLAAAAAIKACDVVLAAPQLKAGRKALAYYWRASARADLKNPAGALADLDHALAVADVPAADRAFILVERGKLLRGQKRAKDARADFDQALVAVPGDPEALYARADLAFAERRYADARADLTTAEREGLDPLFAARLHALRAASHEELKDIAAARADYDRAVDLAPKDADIRYIRADFHNRQKDYELALADYGTTTELAPRFRGGFNGTCWILGARLKRDFDRARTACDTAIKLAPRDPQIQDSAGLVALQQKRWQDAWRHYDAAARVNPRYASFRYGRGLAALKLGRAPAGEADIAAATKADPGIETQYADYGQKR